MPKQQAIIQECDKCKTTFARYEETPLCDACYGIEKAVKSFKEDDEFETLKQKISIPSPDRLWFVADGFRKGLTIEEVFDVDIQKHSLYFYGTKKK